MMKKFVLLHQFDRGQSPDIINIGDTFESAVNCLIYEAEKYAEEFNLWDCMKPEKGYDCLAKISFPDGTCEDEFFILFAECNDHRDVQATVKSKKLLEWRDQLLQGSGQRY